MIGPVLAFVASEHRAQTPRKTRRSGHDHRPGTRRRIRLRRKDRHRAKPASRDDHLKIHSDAKRYSSIGACLARPPAFSTQSAPRRLTRPKVRPTDSTIAGDEKNDLDETAFVRMRIKQHQAQYRGYRIKMERRDLCWIVTLKPTRPELPFFRRSLFQTATQSERVAMAQAKRRVDHALAQT